MKRFKIIPLTFMLTLLAISLFNINTATAGWLTDPSGDTTLAKCDITRLDVSKEEMKITFLGNPSLDENNTVRLDYNVWVETSQLDETADLTWSTDSYEYVCHLTCRWSSGWINESYIQAFRYYQTSDGSAHVEGNYYWNPITDTWVGTNPEVDCAVISGNTISWDVTGAIFREQPLGTGYAVQGIANSNYGLMLNDTGPNTVLVDEFDNMCELPTDTNTPTLPFPATGLIASFVFLASVAIVTTIFRKKR